MNKKKESLAQSDKSGEGVVNVAKGTAKKKSGLRSDEVDRRFFLSYHAQW